jgi:FkbM family methyltransferase
MIKRALKAAIGESNSRRFGSWIRALPMISASRFRRSAYGPLLTGNVFDITYRFALDGAYGNFVRDQIEHLPRDTILLDIGASIGLFSVLGAMHLTGGRVYAFEPNPAIFAYLQDNLARNECDNALAFCLAISEQRPSATKLSFTPQHSGSGSLVLGKNSDTVRITTMDHAIFDTLHEAGKRYAVKLDVEGYELPVLRTLARSTVFADVAEIIVEVSEVTTAREDLDALRHFFTENGFELAGKSSDFRHRDELYVRRCSDCAAGSAAPVRA